MNFFINRSVEKTSTSENISIFQSKWAKLGTLFQNHTKLRHNLKSYSKLRIKSKTTGLPPVKRFFIAL
jgi:hypothetical protein